MAKTPGKACNVQCHIKRKSMNIVRAMTGKRLKYADLLADNEFLNFTGAEK